MDRPGVRYKNLASRCRLFAAECNTTDNKAAALLRMAESYDRRADELEDDWPRIAEDAKAPDLPLSLHS